MKDKILNNVVFVIGCLYAISIVFLQKNLGLLFVVSGGVLLLIGILYALMRKKVSTLIIGLGVSVLATSFLYYKHILDFAGAVLFFLCAGLDATVFLTLVVMPIDRLLLSKKYPIKITATVVDLIRNNEVKGEYYMPVYQYSYENNEYRVDTGGYINKDIPGIGDSKEILMDKDDPTNVYILPPDKQVLFSYTALVFLLVVITMVIVSLF